MPDIRVTNGSHGAAARQGAQLKTLYAFAFKAGVTVEGLGTERLSSIQVNADALTGRLQGVRRLLIPSELTDRQIQDVLTSPNGVSLLKKNGRALIVPIIKLEEVLRSNNITCFEIQNVGAEEDDWKGALITPVVADRLSKFSALMTNGRVDPQIFETVESLEKHAFRKGELLIVGEFETIQVVQILKTLLRSESDTALDVVEHFYDILQDSRLPASFADWCMNKEIYDEAEHYYRLAYEVCPKTKSAKPKVKVKRKGGGRRAKKIKQKTRAEELDEKAKRAERLYKRQRDGVERERIARIKKILDQIRREHVSETLIRELLEITFWRDVLLYGDVGSDVYAQYHLSQRISDMAAAEEENRVPEDKRLFFPRDDVLFESMADHLLQTAFEKLGKGTQLSESEEKLIRAVVGSERLIIDPDLMGEIEERATSDESRFQKSPNRETCEYVFNKEIGKYVAQAEEQARHGTREQALEKLRLLEKDHPASTSVRQHISKILGDMGDDMFNERDERGVRSNVARAQAMAAEALEYDPENTKALAVTATIIFESERYDQALDVMNMILEIEPDNVGYLAMKGLFLLEAYQQRHGERYRAEGIAALKKCLELAPDYPEAKAKLAQFYLVSADFDPGFRLVQELIDRQMIAPQTLFIFIYATLKGTNPDAIADRIDDVEAAFKKWVAFALKYFESLADNGSFPDPFETKVILDISGYLINKGFESIGMVVIDFFAEKFSGNAEIRFLAEYNQGVAYFEMEAFDDVLEIFQKIKDDPTSEKYFIPDGHTGQNITFRQNIYNFIVLCYRAKALALKKGKRKIEMFKVATEAADEAVRLFPQNPAFLNLAGSLNAKLRRKKRAEELYRGSISMQIDFLLPYQNLYLLHMKHRELEEANSVAKYLLEAVERILVEDDPSKIRYFYQHEFYWNIIEMYIDSGKKQKHFLEILVLMNQNFSEMIKEAVATFNDQDDHKNKKIPQEILDLCESQGE
jgi:tetratricopeptide (TPR) repeat protein